MKRLDNILSELNLLKKIDDYLFDYVYVYNYPEAPFIIIETSSDTDEIFEYVKIQSKKIGIDIEDLCISGEDILDALVGYDNWGYSDEYTTCDQCGNIIKTLPDYYGRLPDYDILNECEMYCGDCIKKIPEHYMTKYLLNNPEKANTILSEEDFISVGFEKYDKVFETGYHAHQTDDPKEVYKQLEDQYHVIFDIASVGQFDTHWVVWIKPKLDWRNSFCIDDDSEETYVAHIMDSLFDGFVAYAFQLPLGSLGYDTFLVQTSYSTKDYFDNELFNIKDDIKKDAINSVILHAEKHGKHKLKDCLSNIFFEPLMDKIVIQRDLVMDDAEYYKDLIDTNINWKWVEEQLENPHDEMIRDSEDDSEQRIVSVYIGSIFSLTPSGKYYTPFANSNVTEFEAGLDELFWEKVEREAERFNAWVSFGEGDSSDVYIEALYED